MTEDLFRSRHPDLEQPSIWLDGTVFEWWGPGRKHLTIYWHQDGKVEYTRSSSPDDVEGDSVESEIHFIGLWRWVTEER